MATLTRECSKCGQDFSWYNSEDEPPHCPACGGAWKPLVSEEIKYGPMDDTVWHELRYRRGVAGLVAYCVVYDCNWHTEIENDHTTTDLIRLEYQHNGFTTYPDHPDQNAGSAGAPLPGTVENRGGSLH